MRKRIIGHDSQPERTNTTGWLDLERLAEVEITTEDPAYPIDAALIPGAESGWRASEPGKQLIRLRFEQPLHIRRIRLVIDEHEQQRTQEFLLRWSADAGQTYQEIVRQQYTFSPPDTTHQVEEYQVDLAAISVLELQLTPDIGGGPARASLTTLQVA
jgi:hypothetical protein